MRKTLAAAGSAIAVAITLGIVWILSLDSRASRGRRPQ